MGYRYVNLNPLSNTTGDCAIRACALATNRSWDKTYEEIANLGRRRRDSMGRFMDDGYGYMPYNEERPYRESYTEGRNYRDSYGEDREEERRRLEMKMRNSQNEREREMYRQKLENM